MATNNSINPNNDSDDLEKIDADITKHRKYAFRLIITIFSIFIIYFCLKTMIIISKDIDGNWVSPNFSNLTAVDSGDWGTFGDFIGGILNPIFALFAFYWLTYSVRLQIKELKDTRIELQKAADAQVETAQHQENIAKLEEENVKTQQEILTLQKTSLDKQIESTGLQQRQIELQNFESLFFELLKTKAVALDNILYEEIFINDNFCANTNPDISHGILSGPTPYRSIDAVKKHINAFKIKHKEEWKDYYKNYLLGYMGSYFRICYQIVKLIDQNPTLRKASPVFSKKYSVDQKKYFDLFRSTISQYELEAFFFNCLSPYGNKKFKTLIEKYGLLEPLLIDTNSSNTTIHPLTKYAYRYDRKIFEESPDWNNYFEDMNRINLDTNPKIIVKHANYLEKLITEINFDQKIKETNGFDIIKNKFNELKKAYSEKFKNINHPNELSHDSEIIRQYNHLNLLKQVDFTHEIYIILKYNIDFLAYCDYVSKQRKSADPE